VVAHPDDESLIAGGTLALAARAGATTGVVSLTRGELGPISDASLATPETLGEVREAELRAAAACLGVAWTACLREPDGELAWVDRDATVAEVARLLAEHEVSEVLTFGADGVYGHPDHAAAGEIAAAASASLGIDCSRSVWPADAVRALCDDAAARGLPTGLWGLEPEAFGSWDAPDARTIDVRAVLDQKLAALRAHRTQLGPDHVLTALPDDLAARHLGDERWARWHA
jgi:LmbE family N-acetylglucosaminyl deacetylase